jgi:hypothetical protein
MVLGLLCPSGTITAPGRFGDEPLGFPSIGAGVGSSAKLEQFTVKSVSSYALRVNFAISLEIL